jgi:hypothetical protein
MAVSDHEESVNVLDDNSRPSKKRKISDDLTCQESQPSSPLTSLPPSPVRPALNLKPLPPPILLLALPNLLSLPPNHYLHAESLRLSLIALRKCLLLDSLAPEIECRARLTLAEVGMKIIGGGLSQTNDEHYLWAKGVEKEVRVKYVSLRLTSYNRVYQVEKAVSKGVRIPRLL